MREEVGSEIKLDGRRSWIRETNLDQRDVPGSGDGTGSERET